MKEILKIIFPSIQKDGLGFRKSKYESNFQFMFRVELWTFCIGLIVGLILVIPVVLLIKWIS
jgi:hypothetical protein